MSTERLFLVDPHNPIHLKLINEFEMKNNINSDISLSLKKIANSFSKEEYKNIKHDSNEISETLFIERDSIINDTCTIQGEKDRKICTITYAPIIFNNKKRKLITLATDYALNTLGMVEACVILPTDNLTMINMMEKYGYENLGEQDGKIIYIKDKVEEDIIGYQHIA